MAAPRHVRPVMTAPRLHVRPVMSTPLAAYAPGKSRQPCATLSASLYNYKLSPTLSRAVGRLFRSQICRVLAFVEVEGMMTHLAQSLGAYYKE